MASQYSFNNFALLCRTALPRFTCDVVVSIALAALGAVISIKPSVSCLHEHRQTEVQEITCILDALFHKILKILWNKADDVVVWSSNEDPYHYIITTSPLLAHLQVDNFHPHQCSRTHQLEHICPHWEPDHCHRNILLHRACHIRCQSLQGPGSLVGDRQDRKVHSDCPMDILELYWRKF